GRVTHYSYDILGRVTRTYYLWDNPAVGQADLWVVNTSYYDGVGRVTRTTQATYEDGGTAGVLDLSTDSNEHDANGNCLIVEAPAHGVQVGLAERQTAATSYDALGRVESTTDQYGGVTYNTYDLHGNLIRVQYPDNTETRSFYDEL